jgi:hypothetical protein
MDISPGLPKGRFGWKGGGVRMKELLQTTLIGYFFLKGCDYVERRKRDKEGSD